MTRLNRYILRQLFVAFAFFALVFTGVVWLTQAVRLIDTVVASGQGGRIMLEFSLFVLPQVLVIVIPLAAIGGALYTLNRLYGESELVVMMSAGVGPLALMRPVALFGAAAAAAQAATLMILVPWGGGQLAERTQEIRSDLAGALIVERQFIHPIPGLTLFLSDLDPSGELVGVFVQDQREADRPVTYSAQRARLLRDGDEARLVMLEGVALGLDAEGGQLSAVDFDSFVFDLSELVQAPEARTPRPSEYPVWRLLRPTPEMLDRVSNARRGQFVAEGHYKLTTPALAFLYPLVALVTILAGGYRRSGFGRRVVVAVAVAVALQAIAILAKSRVVADPALWPLMYLPIALGVAYVAALLARLTWPSRPRRAAA